MLVFKLSVFAAIVALSNAAPPSIKHALHEKRQAPSSDLVKVARIESTAILPMRIGLTQSNPEKGHDFLMEVWVANFSSQSKVPGEKPKTPGVC